MTDSMSLEIKNAAVELKGSTRMQQYRKPTHAVKWHIFCVFWFSLLFNGCAAIHPLKGVPAQYLPTEYKGETRSGKETIDLSLLRQPAPKQYLLDSGDVLGVYIEGVLGQFKDVPPVHFPQTQEVAPSLGYPIPIREDGTISLPLIGTVFARGLTLTQLEETIRRKYTTEKKHPAGRPRPHPHQSAKTPVLPSPCNPPGKLQRYRGYDHRESERRKIKAGYRAGNQSAGL